MRYCLVENGKIIKGPILLPRNWNNITNFNLLDQDTLISHGWLPHTFIPSDTTGKIIEPSIFQILPNAVIETQIVRSPTPEELQQDLEQRWKRFRISRNYALYLCDWTQLPDNSLSTDKKNDWAIYRQQLRDLTNSSTVPENITFPPDPNGNIFNVASTPDYLYY